MASFKVGDLVWAKMKSFCSWPAKIIEPKADVKKPSNPKKPVHFVFFFGSENYAWIPDDCIWPYMDYKDKFTLTTRVPRFFREAVTAIEEALEDLPSQEEDVTDLPSIDEEISLIWSGPPSTHTPHKDYTRVPLSGKKPVYSDATENHDLNNHDDSVFDFDDEYKDSPSKRNRDRKPSKKKEESEASKNLLNKKKREHTDKPLKKRPLPPQSPSSAKRLKSTSTSRINNRLSSSTQPKVARSTSNTAKLPVDDAVEDKHVVPTSLKIGFLGLGIMGQGMVRNLLKVGHDVTVWNRTTAKCQDITNGSCRKGSTPAEVVQSCDIIFSCVSDPTAVKDLVFGNCGVLQAIGAGKGFVDLSTIDSETTEDVNEAITARGGQYLEGRAIGSKQQAVDGSLVILASGDKILYEQCQSCFDAIGKNTFYLGELGNATKMKLVINTLVGTSVAALAEGMALAQKLELETETLVDILQCSSLSSPFLMSKATKMLGENGDVSFTLTNMQKDLRLAVALGDMADQPTTLTAAANELYKRAKGMGYGEQDASAVINAATSSS